MKRGKDGGRAVGYFEELILATVRAVILVTIGASVWGVCGGAWVVCGCVGRGRVRPGRAWE